MVGAERSLSKIRQPTKHCHFLLCSERSFVQVAFSCFSSVDEKSIRSCRM